MEKKLNIVFLIFLLPIFSCKKIININLNKANTQIVILGEITNQSGPYYVSLSQTVNFSDSNNFPPVSGAQVIIQSNTGLSDTLSEGYPGIYQSHPNWTGLSGTTYTLLVNTSGKSYSASSTMPAVVNLDSIGFFKDHNGRKKSIEAIPYFKDPAGIANYYQFVEQDNSIVFSNVFIFNDQYSDGKYISQPLYPVDSTFVPLTAGDTLTVSMYCIDKNVYNYFYTLLQITDPNPFNSVTPANPNSNLSGGALGYFSAHTVQSKKKIVD